MDWIVFAIVLFLAVMATGFALLWLDEATRFRPHDSSPRGARGADRHHQRRV